MHTVIHPKRWPSLFLAVFLFLTACAVPPPASQEVVASQALVSPAVQQVLAPQGVLRVGVYLGSPTSLVRDPKTGASLGIAYELGHVLAAHLKVPVQVLEYQRVAEVLDALKQGQVDMTFTNATAERAKLVDFTPALIQLELGLLVPVHSPIHSFEDVDRPGTRLGVSQGSSSQGALSVRLKNVTLVPVPSLNDAQQRLLEGKLDAFATNKGILFELSEKMKDVKVLDDKWGVENLAIAIPKGREIGMPFLNVFARQVQQTGQVKQMAQRAGLRGFVKAD